MCSLSFSESLLYKLAPDSTVSFDEILHALKQGKTGKAGTLRQRENVKSLCKTLRSKGYFHCRYENNVETTVRKMMGDPNTSKSLIMWCMTYKTATKETHLNVFYNMVFYLRRNLFLLYSMFIVARNILLHVAFMKSFIYNKEDVKDYLQLDNMKNKKKYRNLRNHQRHVDFSFVNHIIRQDALRTEIF